MPVLLDLSLVFTFPVRFFVCLWSPNDDLLERAVVHRGYFELLRCTRLFLRLLPLFFDIYALDEKKNNIFFHVLRSADYCLHSRMTSLKITVCASRVIPFDIIIALDIVWTSDPENSLPFYNCSISRARGSVRLYGPIILTAFSLRSISSIVL